MQGKPNHQTQPIIADADSTRSVDLLWDGIQKRYEQVKASNIGRLNSFRQGDTPASACASTQIEQDNIKEPGYKTGLNPVPNKDQMLTSGEHSLCTQQPKEHEMLGLPLPSPSLEQRAQQIIEKNQRLRQEQLRRAAELFLAGPMAWPDYPDYENVEFDEFDDEPLWEPLPEKP